MDTYDAHEIEAKWQRVWEDAQAFHVPNPPPGTPRNPRKRYVLEQLPYPSGSLHMGHMLVYTLGDIRAHFYRRNGYEVMRPMGFDSFGLPAENAAIRGGGHPRETTERNIVGIRAFMKRVGWAIDWDRELSTHEPEYYRWTQWLFLRLFEAGLAYRKAAPVKWCPKDETVIANEQVKDGRCERCGTVVESRNLEQWFFKTTAYADELLDFDGLRWSQRIVAMQKAWIGRSEGAEIRFRIDELDADVPVFTTRPDTLHGATFFVLAPEHPLVGRLASDEVREYVRRAGAKTATERLEERAKTGVPTGHHVTNPVNDERLPVWVADYVLMDYGTGAIMAVPAHDERDRQFAQTFDLPIRVVVGEDGVLVDSGEFSGREHVEGGRAIVAWLDEQGRGKPATSFRLRDWGFSRQRYWGCPIPIVHCEACGAVPVSEDNLPVLLPDIDDYLPKGKPPLAANEQWMRVPCPRCGAEGRREAETMDTFVDSSWYFLRYCDPWNDEAPFDRELVDYWGPVDFYQGGVDHATMHMIYARFFQKALHDLGLVGFREPFAHFHGNGWVQLGGSKMSKSKGNILRPDDFVDRYGADPVRLYMPFIGPADQDMEVREDGMEGMVRFVRRLWRIVEEVAARPPADGQGGELSRKAHETIAKVTDDIGRREQFNTPIAAVMELVNEIARAPADPAARFAMETAVSLIQPYAPHVAEELWERLGRERLWKEPWPEADPARLERETFELVIQVNGKVRDRIEVAAGLSDDELAERAKASPRVQAHLDGKTIRQVVVVPRKLVNLVVG
ncbi:MAG: leucine--tRNA ligase [Actinobacteria bacterium]|nr:leucine--tRNA ligase [Actinomycetota bacterium]